MKSIKVISVLILTIAMCSCSSIVSKSEYAVSINSAPDTATFKITNRSGVAIQSGVTPSTITLKASSGYFKGETYTIELLKEGFQPKTYTLSSSLDGWYLGNILFGGLIGMLIVDPATGAMYKLPPEVRISLDPTITAGTQESFTITTIESLSEAQKEQLVRLQ